GPVPLSEKVEQLAVGGQHTCALLESGMVRCWGRNHAGQLGYGHTRDVGDDESPASAGTVTVGGSVRELAAGASHTCALLDSGAVRCWGLNAQGQLGYGHTRDVGDDESPASAGEVILGGTVMQLAAHATSQHTCARLESGAVRCWGRNAHGQLGLSHTLPIGDDETPASVASVTTGGIALQLATGAEHSCALLSPGVLKCWGRNESGQLGRGNTSSLSTPPGTPVDLGGAMAFQVATGAWHTCALPSSGEPRCWGRNTHGQLGLGHTYNLGDNEPPSGDALTTPLPPQVVETFQSAATVGSGGSLACLVQAMDPQASGLFFSWTANTGTLSTATTASDTSQVRWTAPSCVPWGTTPTVTVTISNSLGRSLSHSFSVTGVSLCANLEATVLAGGNDHSSALKQDGTVWAWGYNGYGQLGDGTTTRRTSPVQVPILDGVTSIAAGSFHTLALRQDGTVWAWGHNTYGQLGDGTTTHRSTPAPVWSIGGITAVAGGSYHGLALHQDGTIWTWGYNYNGQLGDGTTTIRYTPVKVPGLDGVTALAAGYYHTVALRQDGTVWAWGQNTYGQLGIGAGGSNRLSPVQVPNLTGVTALAAGDYYTLALRQDGTVWAWGANDRSQLGDGTTTGRVSPKQVQDLGGIVSLAAGYRHTLALSQDGTVWTWGQNYNGQLGDGTRLDRSFPVQVLGLSGVTAIDAGSNHALALRRDGTVWAWGYNGNGQLGNGTTTTPYSPVQVTAF
ncbi:MAG TPA: RCC1 repeat-containing protein, partial [Archangium sp.]